MPLTLDDFEDLFDLSSGGECDLKLGFDKNLGRWIVLRISDLGSRSLEQEARLYAKLDHPGLVPLLGYGYEEKSQFMVQPYLHGLNLDQMSQVMLGDIVEWGYKWAITLHYLHSQKVLHRDLHPGNLFVNVSGEALILDLGFAKEQSGIAGRLAYLSPEHLGSNYGPQSDVFCLGLCLTRLLLGRDPFEIHALEQATEIWQQGIDWGNVPTALISILKSCLEINPEDRPESALELADALASLKGLFEQAPLDQILEGADHNLAEAILSSTLRQNSKLRHLLHWTEKTPHSVLAQELLLANARKEDELALPPAPEDVLVSTFPWKMLIFAKLALIVLVAILIWAMWPTPKSLDLQQVAQQQVQNSKSGKIDQSHLTWIALPDSIRCEKWFFDQREMSKNKVLTGPGIHSVVCKNSTQMTDRKWRVELDSKGFVKWQKL